MNSPPITQRRIKGTTEECFKHFKETNSLDSDLAGRLMEFVDAPRSTLKHWYNGTSPLGQYKVGIRYFLDIIGYTVTELSEMHSITYNFGQLVALRIITIEEAADVLQFDQRDTHTSVFRVILGRGNTSNTRMELMKETNAKYERKRDDKVTFWKKLTGIEVVQTLQVHGQATPNGVAHPGCINRKAGITCLAHMIQAMLPIASEVNSNAYTNEDRQRLRELAGQNGVFNLSTILNQLCSETARKMEGSRTAISTSHKS